MKTVNVKHFRGQPAKDMARSMKKDVEAFGRARSSVNGKYAAKSSEKGKKK